MTKQVKDPRALALRQVEMARDTWEGWRRIAGREMERFRRVLEEDPSHALGSMGEGASQAAARIHVAGSCLRLLDKPGTKGAIDAVLELAEREVVRLAGAPPRSSSASTNLMHTLKLEAWAESLDGLRRMVEQTTEFQLGVDAKAGS